MAEITYLLGAGASYNALPVVDEMYQRIGDAKNWFNIAFRTIYPGIDHNGEYNEPPEYEKLKKIISDLEWLKEICNTSKNFSVDTFARKLNLSGKVKEYEKLKNILSFFFTIEQKRNPPDVRYDNFWASILKHKSRFPDNIKIISWNYDFQLELTYTDFLGIDSLKQARETLNIYSQETLERDFNDPKIFGIFKLNGSATYNNSTERGLNYLIDEFKESKIDSFINDVVEKYERMFKKSFFYKNHLTFAWEHQTNNPFFNRDIDKLILNEFMGDKLKKVYFQAPDAEDLRERFLAINNTIDPDHLVLRKDIKQFTLPNEL